jgi:hypothetical protein
MTGISRLSELWYLRSSKHLSRRLSTTNMTVKGIPIWIPARRKRKTAPSRFGRGCVYGGFPVSPTLAGRRRLPLTREGNTTVAEIEFQSSVRCVFRWRRSVWYAKSASTRQCPSRKCGLYAVACLRGESWARRRPSALPER